MSSIKRVIRWGRGAGAAGFITEATLSVYCSTAEAVSSVGSGSFLVSIVTYFPYKYADLPALLMPSWLHLCRPTERGVSAVGA